MDELKRTFTNLPRWAVPALVGGVVGLIMLLRRKTAPSNSPVAAATPTEDKSYPTSDTADITGAIGAGIKSIGDQIAAQQASQPDWQNLFSQQGELFSELYQQGQRQQSDSFGALAKQQSDAQAAQAAQNKAIADSQTNILQQIIAMIGKLGSPVTAPATPVPQPPATPPPPVLAPPPVPPTAPAPAPVNTPPPGGSGDWAALAYFLGGKAFTPGGTHFPGEVIQIRWKEPPYNSQEPGPPSGVYPSIVLPVKFNGDHASARFLGESAFTRTLRWTANYMQGHPTANPSVIWDGMLGRLMRDMGAYNNNPTQWYETGFDLGAVVDSPHLDATGRPNPNFIAY